jgi:hypothetical protein
MSNQIRPSVTNPPISTIYTDISDGLLVLAPDFQRKFVWTQEHQEEFIDTILNGLPFPEIYVSAGEVDLASMKTTRQVIDGQQRLTTIKNYVTGNFALPLKKIPNYVDLPDDRKRNFLSYEVVVRDLGKIDEKTIREIFRRINLTKFKLDTVEIHNAIYDGAFISAAKDILEQSDLSIFEVFRESEFSRMADLHFVLLIMSTVQLGGYFSADKEVETLVEMYNETYVQAQMVTTKVLAAFDSIKDLQLPPDSMWFRKSNFFTLVAELSLNGDSLKVDLRDQLLLIEGNVMAAKKDSSGTFGEYYSYMYQNTNSRKARVVRADLFRKYCTDLPS